MTMVQVILFLFLLVPLASTHFRPVNLKRNPLDSRLFSAEGSARKFARRLSRPLIVNDGRVYACSEKDLFSFESNGSVAWTIRLDLTCDAGLAPVYDGGENIYVTAENKVVKIKIGADSAETILALDRKGGTGEIIGLSVSASSSSIYANVREQGLFAYTTNGRLLWTTGPNLNQFGFSQGCRKNAKNCHFTSVPVIDHCENSVYISNNEGELYSLSTRSPQFKWIQDLSPFGTTFTVTPGSNGRIYVIVPEKALLLALDVLTGNVLWQGSIGPLSSPDSTPVIDSNGWISIGSLDGFLYLFSPSGVLKKFSKSRASNSAILASPVLDCSGYAVYVSQTVMESKTSNLISGYTYFTATEPTSVVASLLVPATGAISWSQIYPGELSTSWSRADLQEFVVDERILLAFLAASKTGDKLACRSRRQKLITTCSQTRPKPLRLYTASERAVFWFLMFESAVLLLLAALVRYCCVFWKKRKLQNQGLGGFLDKRRSLQQKKKSLRRSITELQSEATGKERAGLDDLVRERNGVKRKLSTTYSLGRDRALSEKQAHPLPLYSTGESEKARSLSLRRGAQSESSDSNSSWETFRGDDPGN